MASVLFCLSQQCFQCVGAVILRVIQHMGQQLLLGPSDVRAGQAQGGKIAAAGTHTELLNSSELYREVSDSQVKGGEE